MKLIFNPAKTAVLFLFSALVLIFGCKKEESGNTAEEEFASRASTEADAESEFIFDEVFDNVIGVSADVAIGGTGVFGRMNNSTPGETARINACPDVTITHLNAPDIFPVKVVMDFGSGCTARDGRTRSGKIITVYTNRLIYPGAKATTTFVNYKVDSIHVEGTHIIMNQSIAPTNTNCFTNIWKVVVEGAKLTKSNGSFTEWNSTKTITQLEGMCTPFMPLDDVYKIVGGANGKVKRGNLLIAWRGETVEPLIKRFNCRYIVKGTIRIMRLNLATNSPWVATMNYGNGVCDKQAVVTINGVSYNITLP